jgi:hypothetical protein
MHGIEEYYRVEVLVILALRTGLVKCEVCIIIWTMEFGLIDEEVTAGSEIDVKKWIFFLREELN